jgi:hypothetical protein
MERFVSVISADNVHGKIPFELAMKYIPAIRGSYETSDMEIDADFVNDSPPLEIPMIHDHSTLLHIINYCKIYEENSDPHDLTISIITYSNTIWNSTNISTMTEEEIRVYATSRNHVLNALDFLGFEDLKQKLCEYTANLLRGKRVEVMRAILNIFDDFTDEERKKAIEENAYIRTHTKDGKLKVLIPGMPYEEPKPKCCC